MQMEKDVSKNRPKNIYRKQKRIPVGLNPTKICSTTEGKRICLSKWVIIMTYQLKYKKLTI